MTTDQKAEGPPRYFVPVCVKTPLGFFGGPSGYHEVSEAEAREAGPIVIEAEDDEEAVRRSGWSVRSGI